ncbi:MAG TPA: hypothetical protein VFR49_11605 [Solirubrobacteraceae bacterium]|nr:hypothetical protein [Solirubrobacteraceae bacterium]
MGRLRALPWMLLYELATVAHAQWQELPAADRDKLTRLAVKSRGLPTNLTARERAEVKRILGRIDLQHVVRQVVPKALMGRSRRR